MELLYFPTVRECLRINNTKPNLKPNSWEETPHKDICYNKYFVITNLSARDQFAQGV